MSRARIFKIAMDAASSEWKSEKGKGFYKLPKAGTEYTSEELIEHWEKLCDKISYYINRGWS